MGHKESNAFQLFVNRRVENVARWTIAREIDLRKKGRSEISPELKKGDVNARDPKRGFSRPPKGSERSLEIGPGVSRLITLAPATSSARGREIQSEHTSRSRQRQRRSG